MDPKTQEMIDTLLEARDMIADAVQLLNSVARKCENGDHWRRTVVANIEIASDTGNGGWLARDESISDWIRELEYEDEDDEEDL